MLDDTKQVVKEQFGSNAQKYVDSVGHAKSKDLQELVEWLQPIGDDLVLDVATGGGHVAKALSPHVARVTATDLTKEMLQAARTHLIEVQCNNVDFVIADAEQLPFLDHTFDIVTCRIAAHHFVHPDAFVREVARVLKPGGQFLLIDNIAPENPAWAGFQNHFEQLRDPSHHRCLPVSEWKTLFVEAGLSMVQERQRHKSFDFEPWVWRMAASEEQVAEVESYILRGSEDARAQFQVTESRGRVKSVGVGEWMALAKRS